VDASAKLEAARARELQPEQAQAGAEKPTDTCHAGDLNEQDQDAGL
jgi:hypothetical protein